MTRLEIKNLKKLFVELTKPNNHKIDKTSYKNCWRDRWLGEL